MRLLLGPAIHAQHLNKKKAQKLAFGTQKCGLGTTHDPCCWKSSQTFLRVTFCTRTAGSSSSPRRAHFGASLFAPQLLEVVPAPGEYIFVCLFLRLLEVVPAPVEHGFVCLFLRPHFYKWHQPPADTFLHVASCAWTAGSDCSPGEHILRGSFVPGLLEVVPVPSGHIFVDLFCARNSSIGPSPSEHMFCTSFFVPALLEVVSAPAEPRFYCRF